MNPPLVYHCTVASEPEPSSLVAEVAVSLYRGNVALWLGPAWQPSEGDLSVIASVSWLAIWSESNSSLLHQRLKEHWATDASLSRRVLIEVPGRLEEALGSYFSFADVCPFFFLRGREGGWQHLPAREQRRARDEQIDEVGRLGSSVLLVDGYSTAAEAFAAIHDEFPPSATGLRIVICGLDQREQEIVSESVIRRAPQLSTRLRLFAETAASLVVQASAAREAVVPTRPAIKIGGKFIDLQPLLERESPIDQEFRLVTSFDTRPPTPDEDKADIVEQLVSNSEAPWRAFAHDIHWRRNDRRINEVLQHLGSVGKAHSVVSVNIPAEPGSGLTVFLSEIAFRAAQLGHPSLMSRPGAHELDYERLRTFMEYLTDLEPSCPPAVLVFDDSENGFETPTGIKELPLRLARDGRQALVVRGVTIRSSEQLDDAFKRSHRVFSGSGKIREEWLAPELRAGLDLREVESLSVWAAAHWPGTSIGQLRHVVSSWGADWAFAGDPPPLLTSLYFLLRDHVTQSSALGEHIVGRVKRALEALPEPRAAGLGSSRPSAPLSHEELTRAVDVLRRRFRGEDGFSRIIDAPARSDVAKAFLSLCALGCLRIPVPRTVLAAVTNIAAGRIGQAVVLLEREDLVKVLFSSGDDERYGAWARDAFYTAAETLGLRHPGYGRLALEWLRSDRGAGDRAEIMTEWLEEFFVELGRGFIEDYPLGLLVPLLRRVRPNRAELQFVEEICVRLLRLQRIRGSRYHDWLFQTGQADRLLAVLAAVPEQVARQSSVILHTRGMTRYKSCSRTRALEECRRRYQAASSDLQLAYERARGEYRGEQPANVITSHGLLFLGWAKQEQERVSEGGDRQKAKELAETARQYLREGIRLRQDNPYAAYGIADSLIDECERSRTQEGLLSQDEFAERLTEALELLEMEPEASFVDEWDELKARAVALLNSAQASAIISSLQARKHEIGFALEALRILGGEIPYEVSDDADTAIRVQAAWEAINPAEKPDKASSLADLLRYALFSSMPERLRDAAYAQRFVLISKLVGSPYLDRPLWLYDYAMLALQNEKYRESSEAFQRLRKGRRFLEVPIDRAVWLTGQNRGAEPRNVTLRILSISEDGKGWARVEDPRGFIDPVRFPEKTFLAAGSPTRPGAVVRARLRIRPAGPMAEPLRLERDARG